MSAITEKRQQLRTEARERQKQAVPALRAAVRARRAMKKRRLAKCRSDCKRRRARLQTDAIQAREKLRARIKKAKEVARTACGFCKVSATEQELDKLDRALAAVEREREAIRELRTRAGGLVDPRGRAGGRKSAIVRSESDSSVRANIDEYPDLLMLWDNMDHRKIAAGDKFISRTERFLEYAQENPWHLDEIRSAKEVQWDKEAEELFKQWPQDEPIGKLDEPGLEKLGRELGKAEEMAYRTDPQRWPQYESPVPF